MDEYEIARRANELPAKYQNRLSPASYEDVHLSIRVGEWGEGIENLIAALSQTATPITTAERQELAELMTAIKMPTGQLDALTIQD